MDNELRDLYASRVLVRQIAQQLGRSESAVMLRIRKLKLE
jgi:DNA-binding Lrp family transcriptional regulator